MEPNSVLITFSSQVCAKIHTTKSRFLYLISLKKYHTFVLFVTAKVTSIFFLVKTLNYQKYLFVHYFSVNLDLRHWSSLARHSVVLYLAQTVKLPSTYCQKKCVNP